MSGRRTAEARLLHGVCNEARAAVAVRAALSENCRTSLLLVADPRRAIELAAEAKVYAEWFEAGDRLQILHFPERPPPDIDTQRRNDRICERLSVLSRILLAPEASRIIVCTPEALLGECPLRSQFEADRMELRAGGEYPFGPLVEQLTSGFDYDSEALCEHPGQLATRGGLLDIYPVDAKQPYRIDFFGDEIESIRSYDPTTQRTLESVHTLTIAAARGSEGGKTQSEGAFIAFLPPSPVLWILDDPSRLNRDHPYRFDTSAPPGCLRTWLQAMHARQNMGDRTTGLCEIDTDPQPFKGATRTGLQTEAVENYRVHPEAASVGFDRFESEQGARHKFEMQIADWAGKDQLQVCFFTAGTNESARIAELLADNPATARLSLQYREAGIASGFILRENGFPTKGKRGVVLITDNEYFGQRRKRLKAPEERARPSISQIDQLLDFTELADGDPLVHLQHGVCLFRGLSKLDIEGGSKEVISVEFAEQMTIHVPLHESHLLTRYVGLTKAAPKLGKIGGAAWEKTRRAAEVATLDFAAEMLNLHAKRSQGGGYAFPPDHAWQKAFEDAFPYQETPDQQHAIDAAKADMEKAEPMDRLICGDVGFGKTEVAIRAALKAVLAGKQVAVLVPTTVLCQQHFNTFRERMVQFPIIIDMVSRFRSSGQNKQILSNLAEGRIDIVIGTHRLLSKDVHFNNLGLLVVDEEQRFGVRQKERIKQLRADVDILTLSATPIPRTLYLALAGARAMSVIETPPVDRRPIETIVRSYDESLIKSAIQSEVDRGGQVFYLHNRVSTIEGVASKIEAMHPRLRIAVGHGQMEEGQLERIMTKFVAGDYDVLVCTTIIESGIDIPNCNTLIIEGADRFGLSQLYQIRGRVGRFNKQAYAYLLLHRHAALVDQAQKRLNALKQHNQLGAGFRIAMRDLELRGAGNLLGSQQSGHIAGVGFELYCQLLKQSVARLKGEPGSDRIRAEVKLDFIATGEGGGSSRRTTGTASFAAIKEAEYSNRASVVEAALPADYMAEPRLRIDFYRRLAMAPDRATVRSLAEELEDRFGRLPEAARVLVAVSEIRVLAEAAGVRRVETEGERLMCRMAQDSDRFLKTGTRFPRLSQKDPIKRLKEIQAYLARHSKG
ncbi:transcription-repair coupling factor [Coraliomargarita parva]|uniref:transcription-repair coupling factor n=1 Tax=Coraliomargarita parva TaxID=3014050 RepID=UPI0022B41937|nr:transcription-repair coupling factor [Coraliomargarita parva]